MSRHKVGPAWVDEGPQQGRVIPVAYSSVHAVNVGQMTPMPSAGKMPVTPVEAARRRRRSAEQIAERLEQRRAQMTEATRRYRERKAAS